MATCYISEYQTVAWSTAGGLPAGQEPALTDQTVAIGAEAKSAAFNANTRFVRISVDVVCSIKFGPTASTTATTSNKRLAANSTEYFGVVPGQVVSVITNT